MYDRQAAVGVVLRNMRRAAALTAARDKVGGVIVLVAAHGAAGLGIVLDHLERGGAFRRAVGLLAGAFAEQPGVRICGRRIG